MMLKYKQNAVAEFKEYCRIDSVGHDPDQKVQTNYRLSVVSCKCKIVLFYSFWNTSATGAFGLMRVTEKRLTHFLFLVTALTL